jgi:hypothetical protein|tara:strand:+ start:740 stop:1324 length:585 start_codon:yes stop_codon:yes gene_type:complete
MADDPRSTAAAPDPGPLEVRPDLTQSQINPLSELRDIHLPPPIDPWPIAAGWWVLSLLLAFSLALGVRYTYQRWRSNRYRRAGLQQLEQLLQEYQGNQNAEQYLNRFGELIKRIALVCFPRERVASLHGEEWVAFLDRTGHTNEFSLGQGQVLMYGAYEPETVYEVQTLHELGVKWIARHRRQRTIASPVIQND